MGRSSNILFLFHPFPGFLPFAALVVFLSPALPAQTHSLQPSGAQARLEIPLTRSVGDSVISLSHQFLVAGSDTVVLDSNRVLERHRDYVIDYRNGQLRLAEHIVALADSPSVEHIIVIRYAFLPFRFEESYFRRQLVVLKDTSDADTLRVAKPRAAFNVDDIFGSNIQKSGSIVRGFTVGSNRDLSLNSGLRLQMAGKITSEVEVAATLTDESTPIQPEGTTQTLQEFDRVFVEVKGPEFVATLGDFNIDFDGTQFARLGRKLQGAKGTIEYKAGFSEGSATFAAAVTRGKFATNQFQGLESVQGPYRLTGRNNERSIIVIAGTEKVFINGEAQTRGETNDYTIDYSTAEVTFTPRRLITAASRIVVDFEYSDRQYSRSFLAQQTSAGLFGNAARLRFAYVREADDPDSPIDFALTDSARQILAAAGDDREKAVVSGVSRVDTNGLYVRIDSVLSDGRPVQFYRYAPGDSAAQFIVSFSYVGFGRGDYIRQQVGVYVWRGPGAGDYLPIRYLPLPQSHQLLDVALLVTPLPELKLEGEYGRSIFDANRFSSLQRNDDGGNAVSFGAAYAPKNLTFGNTNIGSFDLRLRQRFLDERFVPIDRINDIEFGRKWGIDTLARSSEELQEASLSYSPVQPLTVGTGYGKNVRGSTSRSVRNDATLSLQGEGLPTVQYTFETIRSREFSLDTRSSWLRHKGSSEYSVMSVVPTFRFEVESRNLRSLSADTAKQGSFAFRLFAPGIRIKDIGKLSLTGELEWRSDDLFHAGTVLRESKSFTQAYTARLAEWNNLSTSLDVSLRQKRFSQAFRQLGQSDIKTVLVRSQSRYAPLNRGVDADMFYQVATEQSSRLERVFVRVPEGTGNYKYLGDLNNNGVAEESEFELTRFDGDYVAVTVPSDELFPVIDLKTSLRIRISPRLFLQDQTNVLQNILAAVSTESYVRLEEKSTERDLKQIYLLRFSRFRRDSTTIAGSILFTQDVHFFENRPEFSTRLRFSERRGLNRFSAGIERAYVRERSIRVRWQLIREISNQIDYSNRIDRVGSEQQSTRLRDILANTMTFDFSYRPEQRVELGMKFEVGTSRDSYQEPALEADLNTQTLRTVYAFEGAGQVRGEVAREEILLGRMAESVPFELTGGRVPGKTWLWRIAFDYRVTQFIQATVNYDGRSEGGHTPVHTARAEVRAFF